MVDVCTGRVLGVLSVDTNVDWMLGLDVTVDVGNDVVTCVVYVAVVSGRAVDGSAA